MTEPSVTLRRADDADLDRVESLLAANDLPHEDVRSGPGRFFLAFSDGVDGGSGDSGVVGGFVGVGGVEVYRPHGLLRSVVVEESVRGRGFGTALCDALERRARDEGVEALCLLTTTAAGFFRCRGYGEVARGEVPSVVRETSEFAELCPDSATCMGKDLR